jgi:hypothetical protein
MVDLMIKVKFAEASFDQDSMKICLENPTCVMFHLFVLFSLRECMVDLFIKMTFAETSFDQDSIKNMYGVLLVC